MPTDAKHREISRELAADIGAGKYKPGARLPSEAQLTKRYSVSRPTVARALRDLVTDGLVERRAGSGTYVRREPAVAAETGARQIGLLVAGLGTTEIFDLICGELAGLARAGDHTLLWGAAGLARDAAALDGAQALAVCEQFISRRVAGVVFAPFELTRDMDELNRRIVERLHQAGIPTLLLDRDIVPFPERSPFDLVGVDNLAAGFMLGDHLLRLGCQRIAFLARPYSAPTVDARIAGVREALARHRVTPPPDWIHSGVPEDRQILTSLTKRARFDAVICANDQTAAELIRALAKKGLHVPQDLRVAGFDDAKYATLLRPALTTVHQPCPELAIVAYRALLERVAEPALPPRTLALAPRLVIRESCGEYLK